METPPVQFFDNFVDMPVVVRRQVSMIQKMQNAVVVPRVQYIDRIADVQVVKQHTKYPPSRPNRRRWRSLKVSIFIK